MAWGARNLISTQAHRRPNAAQWSGCDRSKALGLQSVPRSSIHIKQHRRRLLDEDAFAHSMRVADFCLVMCGDTPTSRRIFDAIVADCIPLIVGTRLWGRCEAPCHEGWGWFVSGVQHPHLPFRDTYVAVWKSTSVSGAPDNSQLSHFAAMTWLRWLRRAVRNRHATPSSRRRVDGVEVDSTIQHERAVKF